MGCSTFSEYTVVADISCAKVVVEQWSRFFFLWGLGVIIPVHMEVKETTIKMIVRPLKNS